MKKLFGGGIIAIIMMLVVIPCVSASENEWTVTDITNDDTLVKGSTKNNPVKEGNKTTITYDSASFVLLNGTSGEDDNSTEGKIDPSSTTQNRPDGYAWIGFTITKTNSKIKKVKLPGSQDFEELTSEVDTFSDYVGINQQKLQTALENGTNVIYTYEFKTGDEENDTYTVEIIIKPESIVLYEKGADPTNPGANKVVFNGPEEKQKIDDQRSSEASSTQDQSSSTTDAKNPNTADAIIYSVIAVIISALGLTFVYKKLHN